MNADRYPLNLLEKANRLYPSALAELKRRLDESEPNLFISDAGKFDVSLRDLNADGEGTVTAPPRLCLQMLNRILTPCSTTEAQSSS